MQLTNTDNTFVGSFSGDGHGLRNLVVPAANVLGPISASQLVGTLPSSLLAGTYSNALTFNNPANSFTGDGAGLTDVNAAALEGSGAASFWQLGGYAGTTPGVDFLGTTDTNALELKVNNQRAFRLEPTTNSPNLIGGWISNAVDAELVGATIGGGGTPYAEIRHAWLIAPLIFTARIARLRAMADFAIYTPGSGAGLPLSVLRSLDAPPPALVEDRELFAERIATTATSLLTLAGIDVEPGRSREHTLLTSILAATWAAGRSLDLAGLIRSIQTPPVQRIGVLELESFFPAGDRFGLATAFNNLLASPGFEAWLDGEPLAVDRLLHTPDDGRGSRFSPSRTSAIASACSSSRCC